MGALFARVSCGGVGLAAVEYRRHFGSDAAMG